MMLEHKESFVVQDTLPRGKPHALANDRDNEREEKSPWDVVGKTSRVPRDQVH